VKVLKRFDPSAILSCSPNVELPSDPVRHINDAAHGRIA
jgi:hypothetical protein